MEQTIEQLRVENAALRKQAGDALGYKTALDNQVDANCELRRIAKELRGALTNLMDACCRGANEDGTQELLVHHEPYLAAEDALAETALSDPTNEAILAARDARVRAPLEARIQAIIDEYGNPEEDETLEDAVKSIYTNGAEGWGRAGAEAERADNAERRLAELFLILQHIQEYWNGSEESAVDAIQYVVGECERALSDEAVAQAEEYAEDIRARARKPLEEEIERLKKVLIASENWRKAYQRGKEELYAMGGEVCEAAFKHLPCSEGPLDRASSKYIGNLDWQRNAHACIERIRAVVGGDLMPEIADRMESRLTEARAATKREVLKETAKAFEAEVRERNSWSGNPQSVVNEIKGMEFAARRLREQLAALDAEVPHGNG